MHKSDRDQGNSKGIYNALATPPTDLMFKLDAQILSHDTKAKLW